MRTCLCVLLWFLAAAPSGGQQSAAQRFQGQARSLEQASERKDYDRAIALVLEMRRDPEFQRDYEMRLQTEYAFACVQALAGHKSQALDAFESAVKMGYAAYDHARRDPDLDSLRQEPRFQAAMAIILKRARFWDDSSIATPYREGVEIPEELRLAGLAKVWAEVKHNFAWFEHVPELNWDREYVATIPKVQEAKSVAEYYRVLQELTARLQDAHTNVNPPWPIAQKSLFVPAIETRLLEGKVVVVASEAPDAHPGDEVVAVDGVAARERAEREIRPIVSASTPQGLERHVYGALLLGGPKDSQVEVTLRGADRQESRVKLMRVRLPNEAPKALTEFRLLPGNIGYFAIHTFSDEKVVAQFIERFPEIAATDALILDVRRNSGGNSGNGDRIISYLVDRPVAPPQCRTRLMRSANRAWGNNQDWSEDEAGMIIPQVEKRYAKPIVVLTSAQSGSATEDFLVTLDGAKRVTIVGEPTCGSTGQPLFVGLPAGGNLRICTRNCRYPDGREFNGVGIQPHVRVSPTIADVRTGKDPALEAAIARLTPRP